MEQIVEFLHFIPILYFLLDLVLLSSCAFFTFLLPPFFPSFPLMIVNKVLNTRTCALSC